MWAYGNQKDFLILEYGVSSAQNEEFLNNLSTFDMKVTTIKIEFLSFLDTCY